MPYRAPSIRICGCILTTGSKCQHSIAADRARKARFDQQRPNASARGYDSKWKQARAAYLAQHPLCVKCGQPATVVDHKTPHKGDTKLFWSRSNWQGLCAHHHNSTKQSEEKRR
ncbi:HNH endonuclease signature motif containing protein [Rhizobium sp. GN54]|uniref:HNH endonuclease signature motif containing protein n=1 Tax=Rhizobium sp. GN54 TaxID=2898150 RepID=UPI001E3CFCE8|nr:HNH endonuclease signature motif containing protein [Rhizobium sp. GN54]MCD2185226.1 HNH endonuclease [Rhizobium sp. GN54]